MRNRRSVKFGAIALSLLFCLLVAPCANGWGEDGHRFINRVAAEKLPEDVPQFLRGAIDRLSFLGPEPDRWRDTRGTSRALANGSAPDHFIDIDDPDFFNAIPTDRYQYADWLRSKGKDASKVGFLPYALLEGYEKVLVLFRQWRDPKNAGERQQIEQNIVFYAGVLGHYAADGSQPLHATVNYNGWVTSPNPEGFTSEPLHGRFESDFVKAQIKPDDFRNLAKTARVLDDPFSEIKKFLLDSYAQVAELYRLDKKTRWDAANTNPESKQFVTRRLAAGSQMLTDLWYTAWVKSGEQAARR
jgi:hypothetical protein